MLRVPHVLATSILALSIGSVAVLAQDGQEAQPTATGEESTSPGDPVETSPPNAPDQQPASPDQTRAPQPPELVEVATETIAEGLPRLWSMEFLPDGRMIVSAKSGAIHIVTPEGEVGAAISGVPPVDANGQGGLLDIALAPDFESSKLIFFSFSEPRDGGDGTSVGKAVLAEDGNGGGALENVEVIFQQMPTYDGDMHFGSRLVFGPAGELYVTTGERSDEETRDQAQDTGSGLGKVFRIDQNGEALPDNPFVGTEGALPEIWSYGHRNMQSATADGEGRLWTVEHGPLGGDELNMPEPGKNYGWPEVTYGLDYSGEPMGEGITARDDVTQPVYYWDPVIAPSGMAFYEGEEFPTWQGAFLIGGLVSEGLVVMHMENDRVAFEERIPLETRIRDVRVAEDGSVYVVTEDSATETSNIVKLTAAS